MIGLFISEQYIKDTTPINDNVDMKLLRMAILEAQEIHLLEKIGSTLYNDLQTKYIAQTLNASETVLLNTYIRPMLKYWVMVEGLPMMLFKLSNKSVATTTSDNSTPVQYEDMNYLVKLNKNKAEVYTDRLVRYLLANLALFPLFYQATSSIDTIFPEITQFTTDWYLGGNQIIHGNDWGDYRKKNE